MSIMYCGSLRRLSVGSRCVCEGTVWSRAVWMEYSRFASASSKSVVVISDGNGGFIWSLITNLNLSQSVFT